MPYYVPGYVPAGMELSDVHYLPLPSDDLPDISGQRVLVWTDDPAPMPREESSALRLDVIVRSDLGGRPPTSRELNPIRSSPDGSSHSVSWVDAGGVQGELRGRNVDLATFEQLRDSIVLGPGTEVSSQLPTGYREVFDLDIQGPGGARILPYFDSVLMYPDVSGYAQSYYSAGRLPQGASLGVATAPALTAWPLIVPGYPSALTLREVQGHTAYEIGMQERINASSPEMEAALADNPEVAESIERVASVVSLTWWDDAGLAFNIFAPSSEEAMSMAESLRQVDQSEWDAFVSTAIGRPDLPRTTVPSPDPAPAPSETRPPRDPSWPTTIPLPSQTTLPRQG